MATSSNLVLRVLAPNAISTTYGCAISDPIESTYQEELNGPGGGSLTLPLGHAAVSSGYLKHGSVCQVYINGKYIGGWVIEKITPKRVGSGEAAEMRVSYSGRGLYVLLEQILTLGWRSVTTTKPTIKDVDTRHFNFGSPGSSWGFLTKYAWGTIAAAHIVGQVTNTAYPNPWREVPAEWPELTTQPWIWGQNIRSGTYYMRRTFSLSGETQMHVVATCSGMASIMIDGEMVLGITEFAAQKKTFRADFVVPGGSHTVAIQLMQTGTSINYSGYIAMGLYSGSGEEPSSWTSVVTTNSNGSGWLTLFQFTFTPTISVYETLRQLWQEAYTRGATRARQFVIQTTGEDTRLSSLLNEWTCKVGGTLADFVDALSAIGDWWFEGDPPTLKIAAERGVPRTEYGRIYLRLGSAVKTAEFDMPSSLGNAMYVWKNGRIWYRKDADSVQTYGTIEKVIEVPEEQQAEADDLQLTRALEMNARPQAQPTIELVDDLPYAHVPFENFGVGDTVWAPDSEIPTRLVVRRVMSITAAVRGDGRVRYGLELDYAGTTRQTTVDRQLRALRRTALYGSATASV